MSRLVEDCARHVGDDDLDEDRRVAQEQVSRVRTAVEGLPDWTVESADPDVHARPDRARTNAVLRRYAVMHGYDRASA